jgi:RNA polymerase-binding transcription factor DksA
VTDVPVPSTEQPTVPPDHPAVADAALLDQVSAELGAVDDALRRLDEGTYGTCEVCGAELTSEQLEADPLSMRCFDHRA